MSYNLIAINDSAEGLGALTFGEWVTIQEAVQAVRAEYPDAIAIIHSSNLNVVWQDRQARGVLL